MKKNVKTVSFEVPSSTAEIAKVVHNLESFLVSNNCYDEPIGEVTLAASEAVTNAIIHGNKKDIQKKIFITFQLNSSELRVTIEDQGAGFEPDKIPNPMSPDNRMKTTGRGIYLMKAVVDKVIFNRKKSGMQVKLIKYL